MYNYSQGPFSQNKAFLHYDRLSTLLKGKIPPPITVEIDLADGFCNQSCIHCFFESYKNENSIFFPRNKAFPLGLELRQVGVRAIEFSGGGEPTTHPNFKEIVEDFAFSSNLPLGLVSNGLLLKRVEPVLNLFQWIRISLDAGNIEEYRTIHCSNSFNFIMKSIANLIKNRTKECKTSIGIGFLVTLSNWKTAQSAVEIATDIGVDYIQFRPGSKIKWERLDEIASKILSITELKPTTKVYHQPEKWRRLSFGRSVMTCNTSPLVGIICADGTVPYCCLKRREIKSSLGNVITSSFKDIWFQPNRTKKTFSYDSTCCDNPCKHDAYNEAFQMLSDGIVNPNFL